MTTTTRPYPLPPNVIEHFYLGGERIAAMRGQDLPAGPATRPGEPLRRPEEWLASTVTRWGTDGSGLTELGSLGPLHGLIADDPEGWLGSAHVARWGSSPALLVKLIDAGQRLPVHVHPTRQFATKHLGCPFGKTEAWVVLETPPGGGTVFVGTTRPVRRDEWAELVDAQATDAMLDLLHPVTVNVGDGVLVPSSTPHCIDAGVFIVELQEPTDFSVLLEWDGFDVDGRADGHLGLGFDTAIDAVRTERRQRWRTSTGSSGGRRHPPDSPASCCRWTPTPTSAPGRSTTPPGPMTIPAAFSVVVITGGAGTLRLGRRQFDDHRGDALVVPHAAGPLTFSGRRHGGGRPAAGADAPEPVEQGRDVSEVLVGVDVGSSRVKAVVVDPTGSRAGVRRRGHSVGGRRPCRRDGRRGAGANGPDGRCGCRGSAWRRRSRHRGGSHQRRRVGVLLDGDGAPAAPIIAWYDQRGDVELIAKELPDLAGAHRGPFRPRGDDLQAARAAASRRRRSLAETAEWVVRSLGGDETSEMSLAGRTGLCDLHTGHLVARRPRVPRRRPLVPARRARARRRRRRAGVVRADRRFARLVVAGHDHQVAAYVAGAIEPGCLFESLGTATPSRSPSPLPIDEAAVLALVDIGAPSGGPSSPTG